MGVCLLGVSIKIIALLMAKIWLPKAKSQSEKSEYKVIFVCKNSLHFDCSYGKRVTKMDPKIEPKMDPKMVTDLKF